MSLSCDSNFVLNMIVKMSSQWGSIGNLFLSETSEYYKKANAKVFHSFAGKFEYKIHLEHKYKSENQSQDKEVILTRKEFYVLCDRMFEKIDFQFETPRIKIQFKQLEEHLFELKTIDRFEEQNIELTKNEINKLFFFYDVFMERMCYKLEKLNSHIVNI